MFEAKIRISNWYILKDLLWGQGLRNYNYICDEGLSEDLMLFITNGAAETRDFSHERSRTSPPFNRK